MVIHVCLTNIHKLNLKPQPITQTVDETIKVFVDEWNSGFGLSRGMLADSSELQLFRLENGRDNVEKKEAPLEPSATLETIIASINKKRSKVKVSELRVRRAPAPEPEFVQDVAGWAMHLGVRPHVRV